MNDLTETNEMAELRNRRGANVADAEADGFTIDRHCFPWIAYKGPRFQPDEWFPVITPGWPS